MMMTPEERKIAKQLAQEKYAATPKSKLRYARYWSSAKGKKAAKRFRSSQKFKDWQSEYLSRPDVKSAMSARSSEWHRKPDNVKKMAPAKRRSNLKTKYGITELDYARMMFAQDGVCAVCRGVDRNGKRLAVDHDHVSGKVRGLLCTDCNLTLGLMNDNHDRIVRMANYVRDNAATI